MAQKQPPNGSQAARRMALQAVLGLVLAVLPLAVYAWLNRPEVILGTAGLYVTAALVLRSRLLVAMLAGIGLGLVFESGLKTEKSTTRFGLLAVQVVVGAMIGLAAGVVWERAQEVPARQRPLPRKKR